MFFQRVLIEAIQYDMRIGVVDFAQQMRIILPPAARQQVFDERVVPAHFDDFGRYTADDGIGRDILGHDGAGRDDGAGSDGHTIADFDIIADPAIMFDDHAAYGLGSRKRHGAMSQHREPRRGGGRGHIVMAEPDRDIATNRAITPDLTISLQQARTHIGRKADPVRALHLRMSQPRFRLCE